jgi:hypothetical protein
MVVLLYEYVTTGQKGKKNQEIWAYTGAGAVVIGKVALL